MSRPNFLFIITDQQRADHLGCYGNRVLKTPSLDAIAKSGVAFDRHYVASAYIGLVRLHAPQATLVFDTVDLHYLRESRAAELAGNDALARSALRTRQRELAVVAAADLTLVVSEKERDVLAEDAPASRVEVLSNLHEVVGAGLTFLQRKDLVFVGGFRHSPNVDAVRWFVQEVFPRVRQKLPQVDFHCIGGDVPHSIATLGEQEGVIVHGHVPDLDFAMDGMRLPLTPAPKRSGATARRMPSMAKSRSGTWP